MVRGYAEMMATRRTELEAFSGRVAHDIRSPLTPVRRLVEAHGGAVGVERGKEGGGLLGVELPKAATSGAETKLS